ncbi:MAG: hypothetical protein ACE5KJ_00260 [Candidatus Zixiibacteriota bacterium]
MKHTFLLALAVLLLLGVQGCEKTTTETVPAETLSPPLGLKSITGDKEITLLWYTSNYESDFNGYKVYRLDSLYSDTTAPREIPPGFVEVATLPRNTPCNTIQSYPEDDLENGTTYSFLVVAAKDNWTKISQPSNIINDTPREETSEGFDDTLIWASSIYIDKCGYELSTFRVTDMTGINTSDYSTPSDTGDFICEKINFEGGVEYRLWLAGTNNGGIMDLGYMKDWDDADVAPETGYAKTGYSLTAIPGHVYAIKTGDNHYGKIQVKRVEVEAGWLSFKACYQIQEGNR